MCVKYILEYITFQIVICQIPTHLLLVHEKQPQAEIAPVYQRFLERRKMGDSSEERTRAHADWGKQNADDTEEKNYTLQAISNWQPPLSSHRATL